MEEQQRIKELRRLLEQYEYEYYVLHQPTVSDYEFDQLMKELELLEAKHPELLTPDSPTQRVGSEFLHASASGATYPHRYPMLSLQNSYSWEETVAFYNRIKATVGGDTNLVAELKYDGTSISIIYEHGRLQRALTRGDGSYGEDVTLAILAMPSIPRWLKSKDPLPEYIEVRGELLLPWQEFDRINEERAEEGLPLFANPRNAVAGTIKTKDRVVQVVRKRRPVASCYYLMSNDETWLPRFHHERLQLMACLGLPVSNDYRVCSSLGELKDFIEHWDGERSALSVATDGVVIKVDDYELHEELGSTAKSPRWALAYKYRAESAVTELLSVSFQAARTGVVTPVANLRPVALSGTTVQRASLHNADIIEELDLHIGDQVEVEKGGEIIPKITGVRYDLRDAHLGPAVAMPTHCPECGTPLERDEGFAATFCPNEWGCPAQINGKIEHFCSRKAMDINIGPKTIELLTQLLQVRDVADLYHLQREDLLRLPGFKDRKADNLVESIADSVKVPFDRVLFALGIKLVGSTVAKQLAEAYRSIYKLADASLEELQEQESIGPMIAESIVAYFADLRHIHLIQQLANAGVQMELKKAEVGEATTTLLQGETIVISGTFQTIGREELKELIAQNGGKVASSVSSKTTMMVVGEKVGPSKLAKAEQLGVAVVPEALFFEQFPELRK